MTATMKIFRYISDDIVVVDPRIVLLTARLSGVRLLTVTKKEEQHGMRYDGRPTYPAHLK